MNDPILTPAELATCERLGRADWLAVSPADKAADPSVTEADLIDARIAEAEGRKLAAEPAEPIDWTDVPL